ncbi:hypothetical protein BV25DRAFT_324378 [Artomyces pyxidatus]|uniref:Uncharacterized protein n=1 Tax=Artomyces pyxidatus TaxID=48021 RepID=A0ACB8T731_9AGAM|nr:hypothetical protein BV25DRAFT_324378 [Artomyces pyxidatus]
MVIDWESPRPIYVDTLEPDPSDLGGVIERAAFDNYSALQSVQSPKSSLPSSTQADGGRPPTPRRTSKSPKVEGTESISSSELVERILDRSGTSSRTSTPARTPPNVRPPVSDMSPPAGSQSSHLSQPSSSSPRPLAVIRMLKKSRTSWSPEHSVAGNVSSIALDHPTPLHSNTLSQPLEVLDAPPSTYCDSSSTHTAVRSGAGAREAESIFQKPLVFIHYEPPAPTVEPPSDPHTLALPPSNPLPEEADDRAVYEDDDDLYEGSLGYPDDDALAYNEPCADFGLPSAWPTPEESADMERAALDFLNDYVLTFDSDRSRLASAYSRDATFSYRTYCNDPALAARIDAFALPQGFLRAHELIQGRLDVLSALLSLGSAKLSSSENIDYDFTHMGKGIGGLLVVYGTLYDPQADGRLYVTQSFVLRRKDSDPEDRWSFATHPSVHDATEWKRGVP